MKRVLRKKALTPGQEIAASLREAIAWASGGDVPVRVTAVPVVAVPAVAVPVVDVRALRRKMRLSQTQFAGRFGFAAASIRNWEQGRRRGFCWR